MTEFLFFSMSLSNVFTVLNTLYIVFCMFLLIRSSFVSTVCDVLSTLRAGDHRGSRMIIPSRFVIVRHSGSKNTKNPKILVLNFLHGDGV